MKKLIPILLIILLFPTIILAQKEATPSPEIKPEILEKVKDRLEKTEEIIEKAEAEKWYSQFGLVTNITPSAISISNNGQETEVRLSPETELSYFKRGTSKTEITPEDIQIDYFAIAMGQEITNNKNLLAKRISFSNKPLTTITKQTIIGKIIEIDNDSITISNENEVEISLPSKYLLKIQNVEDPDEEDISIDDRVIAIVSSETTGEETTQEITAMYVIPGINNPLAEENQIVEEATQSAEATESAETEEATESAETE